MSAAPQPEPSSPKKFSAPKFFRNHRPEGVSKYSPLPVECWQMARNGPWDNYTLSRMEEKHLRAYMRLVPPEDQDGKSGRPMLTAEGGYAKLAKMTHSHRSTARRMNQSLRAKGYIVAWDVASGKPEPKREGELSNRAEHKARRYLIRIYSDVRTHMETNPKIGKEPDPSNNGALHFFKLGRGARLLTPDEVRDWDCKGYMQSKLQVKLAKEKRQQGPQLVPAPNAVFGESGSGEGGSFETSGMPAPGIARLFRQVSRTLNNTDIAGMYAEAVKLAGPLDESDIAGLLNDVKAAGGHTKGFKYFAKTWREKAKGLGEGRAADGEQETEQRVSIEEQSLAACVEMWTKVFDHSARPDDAKWWKEQLGELEDKELVERARIIARERMRGQT